MNPVLRELGFSSSDRVAVVHADDIGMCQATLPAIEELMAFGLVTSASAMVPCPWLPEIIAWRRRQSNADLGVHLTLTSEWESYRWRALSSCSLDSGLVDDQGYLHGTTRAVRQYGTPAEVRAEFNAQIDRAEQLGLCPSHIDNHMYVAMCREFLDEYLLAAVERAIPAFLPRALGSSDDWFQTRAAAWESRGLPVFDNYKVATNARNEEREERLYELFRRLPVGLSCVLLHPAIDTPEMRSISPDWPSRVADFEAFRSPALRDHIHELGIQLISYEPLRNVMRSRLRREPG